MKVPRSTDSAVATCFILGIALVLIGDGTALGQQETADHSLTYESVVKDLAKHSGKRVEWIGTEVGRKISAESSVSFWVVGETKPTNEAVFATNNDDSKDTEASKAGKGLTRKVSGIVSGKSVEYTLPTKWPEPEKKIHVPLLSKVVVDVVDDSQKH